MWSQVSERQTGWDKDTSCFRFTKLTRNSQKNKGCGRFGKLSSNMSSCGYGKGSWKIKRYTNTDFPGSKWSRPSRMTGWMNSKWSRPSKKLPQLPTSNTTVSTVAAPPLSFQTCWALVSSHWHPQQPNLLPVASASSTGWSIGICPHPNFPQRPGSYNLPLCPVMKNGHFTFGRSNFSPRTFPNPLGKERVIGNVFATEAFLPKCREKNIEIYPTIISVSLSSKYMVKHYNNSPNWLKIMFGGFPPLQPAFCCNEIWSFHPLSLPRWPAMPRMKAECSQLSSEKREGVEGGGDFSIFWVAIAHIITLRLRGSSAKTKIILKFQASHLDVYTI